jgi:hypothetical protein
MVTVTISSTGSDICALSNRQGDGLTAAFNDEMEMFLTWKCFKQHLSLRLAQNGAQPNRSSDTPRSMPVALDVK